MQVVECSIVSLKCNKVQSIRNGHCYCANLYVGRYVGNALHVTL